MSHQFRSPDFAGGGSSQKRPVHPPEQPQSTATVSFSQERVSFSRTKHSPPFKQGFGVQLLRTHMGASADEISLRAYPGLHLKVKYTLITVRESNILVQSHNVLLQNRKSLVLI